MPRETRHRPEPGFSRVTPDQSIVQEGGTVTAFSRAWSESGDGQDPFAFAVYNQRLYFFVQYGQVRLNSVALSDVLDETTGTLTTDGGTFTGALTSTPFSVNPGFKTIHPKSPSSSAATVVGDFLCLFWHDNSRGPMSVVCDTSNIDGPVRPWYTLLTPTNGKVTSIAASDSDVAVTTLDNDNFLLAVQGDMKDGQAVWIGQFRLSSGRTEPPQGSHNPGT